MDYGNVQEFITWIVAGAALLFARRAALAAQETNRQQAQQLKRLEKDQRRRDEQDRRSQAECIAAWHEDISVNTGKYAPVPPDSHYIIRNNSDVPVYGLDLWAISDDAIISRDQLDIAPPGESRLFMEVPSDDNSALSIRVALMFSDAAGRRWIRDYDGRLIEIDIETYMSMSQLVIGDVFTIHLEVD